jgi:hypothetical protein
MQAFNNGRYDRLGGVPNAKSHDFDPGIRIEEVFGATSDLRKKITCGKFVVV